MNQQCRDGLDVLREALSINEVMALIEKTAQWVAPETFKLLPVWYPEFSRRSHFYKANWSEPQLNKNKLTGNSVHKQESNTWANEALTRALGLARKQRPNWSCCHIWGGDDLTYQKHNAVVQDPRFYSCVANMVLLPSPLKAFTDALIEVKTMLRICAKNLYGWECDHESMHDARVSVLEFNDWSNYPKSWPTPGNHRRPKGVVELNDKIRSNAAMRKAQILNDMEYGGAFYPRENVRASLSHWKIDTGS